MTLSSCWASPILTSDITDIATADATITHILSNYNLETPPGEINDRNIFDDSCFDAFLENIVEPAFDEYLTKTLGKSLYEFEERSYRGWITGTTPGYNMLTHNHSGSQLSAVFYLLNDQPDAGGDIVFLDPRSNANRSYKINDWGKWFEPVHLKTPSYTFAVFPSFVYHQVTPYNGKLRIAIPVDLFV